MTKTVDQMGPVYTAAQVSSKKPAPVHSTPNGVHCPTSVEHLQAEEHVEVSVPESQIMTDSDPAVRVPEPRL